ncbi:MAG: alpha/beta fold hydrolase, partial [Myxococcota bacterium]
MVLAHGFGGSARNWRPQLRSLRGSHRTIVYDARGHARSAAPEAAAAYRIDAFVDDLLDVAARTGDPRPVLGGLSFGAAVALRAALTAPEQVRALVLTSLPAGPESDRGIAARAAAFAEAIDADGLEAAGGRFVWGEGSGLDAAGARWVRQGFLEHAPHALAHTLRETLAKLEP